jgi:adenylosuccinate lyase
MELNALTAIGPLDGRYRRKIAALTPYFSEYALIRYRVWVEIEYLIAVHEIAIKPLSPLPDNAKSWLRSLYEDLSVADAQAVKEIEATTNHDVKAVEYWLKNRIDDSDFETLKTQKEFIHFGLTSQDINNTAVPMSLRDALRQAYPACVS